MRYFQIIFSALLILVCLQAPACNSSESSETDSENRILTENEDTISIKTEVKTLTEIIPSDKKPEAFSKDKIRAKIPDEKENKIQNEMNKTDSGEINYYINGAVSLFKSPWEKGARKWKLYNLKGEVTIELEEIHRSYTLRYTAKFHENGAVKEIRFSENPGASLYHYEGHMTFSTTNDPLTRISRRMPYENLQDALKPWMYWDKNSKSWREQESME